MVPEMPPQMERRATLISWSLRAVPLAVQVVPVIAAGLTVSVPLWTRGMTDAAAPDAEKASAARKVKIVEVCIFREDFGDFI
jgi:hypothetical protein